MANQTSLLSLEHCHVDTCGNINFINNQIKNFNWILLGKILKIDTQFAIVTLHYTVSLGVAYYSDIRTVCKGIFMVC